MSEAYSQSRYRRLGAKLALVLGLSPALTEAAASRHDPIRVRISAALVDEELRALLPATLPLPRALADLGEAGGKTITLAELKYCGAGEKGGGRFRAVTRQGAMGKAQVVLSASDGCEASLSELAKRAAVASGADDGFAVADLEAAWKPWELRLAVARAVVVGKGGRKGAATAFDKRGDILTVPTSDLRINTDAGAPIVLHAAPSFAASVVDLAVVMAEVAPGKAGTLDRTAAGGRGDVLPGQANMAVEIPLPVANQVLRRLTWTQPLTIPVNGDEIEIRQVSLSASGAGEGARVTASGSATPRTVRETMRWTLALAGDPLLVSGAQFSAELEDCAGQGTLAALSCNVRNGARGAAAETFAAAITQRYQGQPAHELASPLDFRFEVVGQRIELRGALLHLGIGARGLSAAVRLGTPVRE
jgi:hypothetical protein